MKKTMFLAVCLPFLFSCSSAFDKKKEAEKITEEVTPPWTSAQELNTVEEDFIVAYEDYREAYSGGDENDIRTNFKETIKTSAHNVNGIIGDEYYHDWRVDNPDADGSTFLTVPVDEADYLYGYFEEYPGYFEDWRSDYTMYGEVIALDSMNATCDTKIVATVDAVCQTFIENWRIAGENPDKYDRDFLKETGILLEK